MVASMDILVEASKCLLVMDVFIILRIVLPHSFLKTTGSAEGGHCPCCCAVGQQAATGNGRRCGAAKRITQSPSATVATFRTRLVWWEGCQQVISKLVFFLKLLVDEQLSWLSFVHITRPLIVLSEKLGSVLWCQWLAKRDVIWCVREFLGGHR